MSFCIRYPVPRLCKTKIPSSAKNFWSSLRHSDHAAHGLPIFMHKLCGKGPLLHFQKSSRSHSCRCSNVRQKVFLPHHVSLPKWVLPAGTRGLSPHPRGALPVRYASHGPGRARPGPRLRHGPRQPGPPERQGARHIYRGFCGAGHPAGPLRLRGAQFPASAAAAAAWGEPASRARLRLLREARSRGGSPSPQSAGDACGGGAGCRRGGAGRALFWPGRAGQQGCTPAAAAPAEWRRRRRLPAPGLCAGVMVPPAGARLLPPSGGSPFLSLVLLLLLLLFCPGGGCLPRRRPAGPPVVLGKSRGVGGAWVWRRGTASSPLSLPSHPWQGRRREAPGAAERAGCGGHGRGGARPARPAAAAAAARGSPGRFAQRPRFVGAPVAAGTGAGRTERLLRNPAPALTAPSLARPQKRKTQARVGGGGTGHERAENIRLPLLASGRGKNGARLNTCLAPQLKAGPRFPSFCSMWTFPKRGWSRMWEEKWLGVTAAQLQAFKKE